MPLSSARLLRLVLVRYHGNVTEQLQSPQRTCGEYCRDFANWISLRAQNISLKALQSRHQSSFLIVSRLSFTKDRHADEYCNTVYYTVLQYKSFFIALILYRTTLSYTLEAQPIVGCEPIWLNQSGPQGELNSGFRFNQIIFNHISDTIRCCMFHSL